MMSKNRIFDCITFFDENLITNSRFEILNNVVDYFIVCESKYDHRNNPKKLHFDSKFLKDDRIKYVVLEHPFPDGRDIWRNQAIQM